MANVITGGITDVNVAKNELINQASSVGGAIESYDDPLDMFSGLRKAKDIRKYSLYRGTTDWTQLEQFNMYESGYPYLIMVSMPEFIKTMAENNPESNVGRMASIYRHIIENEFLGFESGLENINSETQEINNGYQTVNVITKTVAPSGTNFSMRYREKAGAPIERMHEFYLRSIRDPATGFKTYNGMIGFNNGQIRPWETGFDKECFSFLYMHTDNTGLLLERAVYWVCCQPTSAQVEIFNGTKGDITFQDVTVEFNGLPLMGNKINEKAQEILNWMNSEANANMVVRNSWNYDYALINGGSAESRNYDETRPDQDHGLNQARLLNNDTTL